MPAQKPGSQGGAPPSKTSRRSPGHWPAPESKPVRPAAWVQNSGPRPLATSRTGWKRGAFWGMEKGRRPPTACQGLPGSSWHRPAGGPPPGRGANKRITVSTSPKALTPRDLRVERPFSIPRCSDGSFPPRDTWRSATGGSIVAAARFSLPKPGEHYELSPGVALLG